MQRSESELDDQPDINDALLKAAQGDTSYEMWLYDDAPYLKQYPPHWERAFVAAADIEGADRYFLDACFRTLVNMESRWVGMPRLGEKILTLFGGSLMHFTAIHRYAVYSGWNVPVELCRAVGAAYDRMSLAKRMLLLLDGPTRQLIKKCAKRASEDVLDRD